jgi:hypothetical protein
MKYLIFFLFIACTSGFKLGTKKECREFEKVIKENWDLNGNKATKSFIDSVENKYSDCLIGKDTTYLFKLFGHSCMKSFAACRQAKMSYEYYISTQPFDSLTSWSLFFGIDSLGLIKCAAVIGTRDGRIIKNS